MITVEKLKRELLRPFQQLSYHIWKPVRRTAGIIRRIRYDASRPKLVRVTEGAQHPGREVAVLLIYQPQAVPESIYFTLSYLTQQGISPVVVSNLPLTSGDRDRLAANSWLVIERPNVGYDFGGYREGILTVFERGVQPEALYVLNDSVWFPLADDSKVIEKSRAASEDIFGFQIDYWKNRGKLKFVHSYFYRFSERIVANREFGKYWQEMTLLENKRDVIEGHEIKLTYHFLRKGFSAGGINDRENLKNYIVEVVDEVNLQNIIKYQYQHSRKERRYLRPIVEGKLSPQAARDQLGILIKKNLVFRQSLLLHPWIYQALNLDYLKKARYPALNAQRSEIRQLGLHKDYHPAVRDEIERWDTA